MILFCCAFTVWYTEKEMTFSFNELIQIKTALIFYNILTIVFFHSLVGFICCLLFLYLQTSIRWFSIYSLFVFVILRMWTGDTLLLPQIKSSTRNETLLLSPFIPPSEVVVFLLDVSMCVLEAERLDVVGDVSNAPVEFLRSWSQRAVVIPAEGKKREIFLHLSDFLIQMCRWEFMLFYRKCKVISTKRN